MRSITVALCVVALAAATSAQIDFGSGDSGSGDETSYEPFDDPPFCGDVWDPTSPPAFANRTVLDTLTYLDNSGYWTKETGVPKFNGTYPLDAYIETLMIVVFDALNQSTQTRAQKQCVGTLQIALGKSNAFTPVIESDMTRAVNSSFHFTTGYDNYTQSIMFTELRLCPCYNMIPRAMMENFNCRPLDNDDSDTLSSSYHHCNAVDMDAIYSDAQYGFINETGLTMQMPQNRDATRIANWQGGLYTKSITFTSCSCTWVTAARGAAYRAAIDMFGLGYGSKFVPAVIDGSWIDAVAGTFVTMPATPAPTPSPTTNETSVMILSYPDSDCAEYTDDELEAVLAAVTIKVTEVVDLFIDDVNINCMLENEGFRRSRERRQNENATLLVAFLATGDVDEAVAAIQNDPSLVAVNVLGVTLIPAGALSQLSFAPTSSEPTGSPTVPPTANPTPNPTPNPTANPTVSPTLSCPQTYDARDDIPVGNEAPARSLNNEQACADICSQQSPEYSGHGCLGFRTYPGVANAFGYVPTMCVLTNGREAASWAPVPCAAGSKCCTLAGPPPMRHAYCPTGYGDYGTRFNWGLGKIVVVRGHAECAARCTRYAGHQYNGGCKAYMTGMYYGMLFCRSYGGSARSLACAPWAVPNHSGMDSGALGSVHGRTNQRNIGGNCCSRTSSVMDAMAIERGV